MQKPIMTDSIAQILKYVQAYKDCKDLIKNLKSYAEPESFKTQAELLLNIGQVITDIDDIYNVSGRDDTKVKAYKPFYNLCYDYFENPIIIALINQATES